MNYATDTADFGMLQHISLCKLLAILIAILNLQGGFPVRSFKDGASVLPMSILRERDYEDFLTKSTSSFDDSPISDFFQQWFPEEGCLVSKSLTLL